MTKVKLTTYDIPINFKIEAVSEKAAEQKAFDFIKALHWELMEWDIVDAELVEFIPNEISNS